jgi:hypothetical protein
VIAKNPNAVCGNRGDMVYFIAFWEAAETTQNEKKQQKNGTEQTKN